ncbi:MAG TPA: hypothetical protein VKS00_07415, partial [Candidatus Acidoferrales bacterium]|nr:hypothetical protein [Candidatus Acidoferrales bacterium]
RTREYVERGESEGKTLIDAMRDGETEGMQTFDGELERLVRAGTLDLEPAITYSTNSGNLRLLLADLLEQAANAVSKKPTRTVDPKTTLDGIEIER